MKKLILKNRQGDYVNYGNAYSKNKSGGNHPSVIYPGVLLLPFPIEKTADFISDININPHFIDEYFTPRPIEDFPVAPKIDKISFLTNYCSKIFSCISNRLNKNNLFLDTENPPIIKLSNTVSFSDKLQHTSFFLSWPLFTGSVERETPLNATDMCVMAHATFVWREFGQSPDNLIKAIRIEITLFFSFIFSSNYFFIKIRQRFQKIYDLKLNLKNICRFYSVTPQEIRKIYLPLLFNLPILVTKIMYSLFTCSFTLACYAKAY